MIMRDSAWAAEVARRFLVGQGIPDAKLRGPCVEKGLFSYLVEFPLPDVDYYPNCAIVIVSRITGRACRQPLR